MTIAYFSPLPPQRSGIADYSADLLPSLAKLAQVDAWIDEPTTAALPGCRTFDYVKNPDLRHELRRYEAIIYHMGNSPAHKNIFPMVLAYPGVVVLHDFVLHHFLAGYYLETLRSKSLYVEEMAYNYGSDGEELARSVVKTGAFLWEQEPMRYPLNKRILDHARAVVVHSEFAARLLRKSHPHLPIAKVNLPAVPADGRPDTAELKRRFGIAPSRTVIASLGSANHAKRTGAVMRAIAALGRRDMMYLIVGEMGESFRQQARSPELEGLVRITGYVDGNQFDDYCNLVDIGIDLRNQTMGESSASLCRLLGAGKPCVISDLGWFAEIPDDCAVKVDAAADELVLAGRLSELIEDDHLRHRIGESARQYINKEHSAGQAAAQYIDFIEEVRASERRGKVQGNLVSEAGAVMAEFNVGEDDGWLIDGVADEIATLFGARR